MNYISQAAHDAAKTIISAFIASKAVIIQTKADKLSLDEFIEVTENLPMPPAIILGVLNGIEAVQLDVKNHTINFSDHLKLPPLDRLKTKIIENAKTSEYSEDAKKQMQVNTFLITTYLFHLTKNMQIVTTDIAPGAGFSKITLPSVTYSEIKSTMDFFLA